MDEEKLTMADFEDEINASFVKFRPGQAIKGTVVAIDEDEIALDLQSYSRGIIPKEEWSNDPDFHAMDEIRIGDMLTVIVLYEDESDRQSPPCVRRKKWQPGKRYRMPLPIIPSLK